MGESRPENNFFPQNDQKKLEGQKGAWQEKSLKEELNAERFMLDQILLLSETEDIDGGINRLLCALGEYTHADRAYIFETDENYTSANTYEWCADEITPQIRNLDSLPFESMPNWIARFLNGDTVLIEDLEAVRDEMPQEYDILKPQGIRTLIAFPVSLKGKLIGFVGVDNPDMKKSRLIARMLNRMGTYVGRTLEERRAEQMRLELERIKSRTMYRRELQEILSGAEIGIWTIILQEGKLPQLKADRTMRELHGLSSEDSFETSYRNWVSGISTGDLQKVLDTQDRIIREGYGEVTYRWAHPQRGDIWIRGGGSLYREYDGEGICLRGYHQDVTRVMRNEMKYQNLVRATSQIYYAIYRIDMAADYMEQLSAANEAYQVEGDFGTASVKLMRICSKYVVDAYQERMREFLDFSTLQERLEGKLIISREYINVSGTWRRGSFIVQSRENGKASEVLYVTQGIDEYKQKELAWQQELMKAVEAERKANQAKSDFLSRMSHDIRTPINGIMGMLEIEARSADDPEKQKECREKIRISAEHLLALVNDVLDVSKLESGEIHLDRQSFDLREMLRECWSVLEVQAKRMNLAIAPIQPGSILHPYVIGSPLHLKQIFLNLLSNSVKYNRPGGSIRIYAKETACSEDTVYYRFTLEDTGIGMDEKFMEHLFEPFTQENAGARTVYQGTGLGMTIVKRLVENMDGTIAVQSQKGIGTVFTVEIPFEIDQNPQKETAEPVPEICISGMRVLVAEDNELNMEIVRYFLEEAGVIVVPVVNGQEAVDRFLESEPGSFDMILMDVMMPVKDGLQAAREIRESGRADAAAVPIAAVTANAFSDDVQRAKEAGMNEHLAKPLNTQKLLQIIAKYRKKETRQRKGDRNGKGIFYERNFTGEGT